MLIVSMYFVLGNEWRSLSNQGVKLVDRLRPGSESLEVLQERCRVILLNRM